jgi:UDP-N-acetyl-D-galactosamine dehydrogenase
LESFGIRVDVYDPLADEAEVRHEYSRELVKKPVKKYHGIVMAVAHQEFTELDWKAMCYENSVVYDVKGVLDRTLVTARL